VRIAAPEHSTQRWRRLLFVLLTGFYLFTWGAGSVWAQNEVGEAAQDAAAKANGGLSGMFDAGGVIGIIILALSVAMVALIVEHLLSIRRDALMPPGLADDVHSRIADGQFKQAEQFCRDNPSLLGHILSAGLDEVGLGYTAIEKSMEDAAAEHSARLHRKIEYLSIIGTIAPMLGLLGTVWGMIHAFMEFENQANPQVSDLAPGIYKALVTTLLGLAVAVPALASFAIYRNRIDELVAQTALAAERVFADLKRTLITRRETARQKRANPSGAPPSAAGNQALGIERETTG